MKSFFVACGLFALVCTAGAVDVKIATVDLQKVLKNYYRAQEATKQLEVKETSFLKEIGDLRLDLQRQAKETSELQSQANDTALSPAGRDEKKKLFELKLADLRAFEVKYETTRAQRESEFQNQAALARKRILDDVLTTTGSIGDKEGYNLVLKVDTANPAASEVLFAKGVDDLTEKVLVALNANRPVSQKQKRQ